MDVQLRTKEQVEVGMVCRCIMLNDSWQSSAGGACFLEFGMDDVYFDPSQIKGFGCQWA